MIIFGLQFKITKQYYFIRKVCWPQIQDWWPMTTAIKLISDFVMSNYRLEEKLKQPLIGKYVKTSDFRNFREFRNVLF